MCNILYRITQYHRHLASGSANANAFSDGRRPATTIAHRAPQQCGIAGSKLVRTTTARAPAEQPWHPILYVIGLHARLPTPQIRLQISNCCRLQLQKALVLRVQ